MRDIDKEINQMKVNQKLTYICEDLKNKTNIKKNYIEYISALLYIKYVEKLGKDISFERLYKEKKNFYIAEIIDKELFRLRSELKNPILFSNIEFKNIVVYREIGEENILSKIIEDIYSLEKFIRTLETDTENMIAKAYEYILNEIVMKDDITKTQKEFYTPNYIVNLMSQIVLQNSSNSILDPYCGSGNFLLKANEEKKLNTTGIERNINIYNICMTNLLLHNIENCNIKYQDEENVYNNKFDLILTNPPFSQKNWVTQVNEEDKHYIKKNGLPLTAVADYAYVLSMLNHLSENGKMGIILPHGVLFRANEKEVRQNLVINNNIEAIIGLPENLFYSTRITVIVLIISKHKKDDKVLFVDASKEYISERKNNVLTEEIQEKIIDVCKNRKEVEYYSHLASREEIEKNNFNLTIKRYVKEKVAKKAMVEKQDIIKELKDLEREKNILEENVNDVLETLNIKGIFEKNRNQGEININSIDYKRIGENIRRIREERGCSIIQLSLQLSMMQTYLYRIEEGRAEIKLDRLVEICNVLNVPLSEVLK